VDVPGTNFINLDYTLINATTNTPLVSTSTRIKRVSNGTYGYGITNNAGFVSGLVPKNEALVLEVVSRCGTVIYSQNVGLFSANTSLRNINVTIPSSLFINFSGTLLNCNGIGIPNGYLSFYGTGGNSAVANTNASGNFSFSILNCNGNSVTYNYIGYDNINLQQSNILSGISINGNINLGNINVCGGSNIDIYIAGSNSYYSNQNGARPASIWRNGIINNLLINQNNAQANSVFVAGNDVYVAGRDAIPYSYSLPSLVLIPQTVRAEAWSATSRPNKRKEHE
jgi:hypothetical protein